MLLNYKNFIKINEANVKNVLKRTDLNIGDDVMTIGMCDELNLDYKIGKIIHMREYGRFLVEFEDSFNSLLHSGHENIGKEGQCYYVNFENILSNDKEKFKDILDTLGKEKLELIAKLNEEYKVLDVVVGVGFAKSSYDNNNIKIDGEIGIVYNINGSGSLIYDNKNRNNKIYYVGFLDKFNTKLGTNEYGLPLNGAGLKLDKLCMKHITPEQLEKVKDKVDIEFKKIKELTEPFKEGDVVTGIKNYHEMKVSDQIGIVVLSQDNENVNNRIKPACNNVRFVNSNKIGFMDPYIRVEFSKTYLRLSTPEEIEKNKDKINETKQEIYEYNYPYKIGDYIVSKDKNDTSFDNKIGKIINIEGQKPNDRFRVSFISFFSPKLRRSGENENCYTISRTNITFCKDPKIEEMIKRLKNKEVFSYLSTLTLLDILNKSMIDIKVLFFNQSYFDVTDNNSNISFLPINKYSRLEPGEDPYKSRYRQQMGIGKFIRLINPELSEKDVEKYNNTYKANYDLIVKGISENFKLVSGEDIRYWYCEDQYVTGGGVLNSSCMKGKNKGNEMQMFVDNPDVIQMLILINDDKKLLGRALVWRLTEPSGQTYMDYIYTRFDKDKNLFLSYGRSRNWLMSEDKYNGNKRKTMVCTLNTDKKYKMGVSALDHFDSFDLDSSGKRLTGEISI